VLEAGFTKNGMFAEICKTVVSSAPAAARSAAPADIETEMAEEESSEMTNPVRAKRSAALFRLTYASAPVVVLEI
jgi:hypothetical protein